MIRNNQLEPVLLYSTLQVQNPGEYFQARAGDIREMSPMEIAFLKNEMVRMSQELDSEFGVADEEQNVLETEVYSDDTEDEMSITTRSPSLSADFNRLTIEGGGSLSPRSALIHGLPPTTVGADEIPQQSHHIIISGDHTETDDNFYSFNLNSHKVENNIVEKSFEKGEQEVIGV
jgi:hypothetical protein